MTTTRIKIHLNASGYENSNVFVKTEVFDSQLQLIDRGWTEVNQIKSLEITPGTYGIRASLPSGFVFDRFVQVEPGEVETCEINLDDISPHESQEWAYLTQSIEKPGARLLSDRTYEGAWIRMWKCPLGGSWEMIPIPINNASQATWNEDGVTYHFRSPGDGFFIIQIGGPRIPWKNVVLPSSYKIKVLIRPAVGPLKVIHPLEVFVSGNDLNIESLLTLMQRGDILGAKGLNKHSRIAEQFLFEKGANTNAAAVGGYFLLRTRDLDRLHDWARNLANWFDWMADGAVIHAWQLIIESKQNPYNQVNRLNQSRDRFLQATQRGIPVYTEGLRLLRDGLLFFNNRAEGKDLEIADALAKINEYSSAADWSATTTSFTGISPDEPDAKSRMGTPRKKDMLIYVFDVPMSEIARRSTERSGEKIVADISGKKLLVNLNKDGQIKLKDGRTFSSIGSFQKSMAADSSGVRKALHLTGKEQALSDIVTDLRTIPRK